MNQLIKMSNKYGAQSEYVLAGGGNSSYKDNDVLIVKASGFQLSDITAYGFVKLCRHKLSTMWSKAYDKDTNIREREILLDLMDARLSGETNRPSVETQLHDLFPFRFVLHLHPNRVNAMTCGKEGKTWLSSHFPKTAVWVESTNPGYTLAMKCKERLENHKINYGFFPKLLLLENHGVFFAADSITEIDELVQTLMQAINEDIKTEIDLTKTTLDNITYEKHLLAVKSLDKSKHIVFEKNRAIDDIIHDPGMFDDVRISFTPDHVVYCRHKPLLTSIDNLNTDYQEYIEENGFQPRIILLDGSGMFAIGDNEKQAKNAGILFMDQIKIAFYSKYFGGPKPMTEDDINFILNWEVENYRLKVMSE